MGSAILIRLSDPFPCSAPFPRTYPATFFLPLSPSIMTSSSEAQLEALRPLGNAQNWTPELPSELERDIFELTAMTQRGSAVKLALVAQRTRIWMERLLYQTIILDSAEQVSRFLYTVDVRQPAFFADYVKKLYLTTWAELDTVLKILEVCTGITHLTSWAGPETPACKELLSTNLLPSSLLSALSLRSTPSYSSLQRMSVKLETLVVNTPPITTSKDSLALANITNTLTSPHGPSAAATSMTIPAIDFSHPVFRQLTHLDIVCPPFYSLAQFRSSFTLDTIPITQHTTPRSARNTNPVVFRVDWNGILRLPKLRHLSFGELYNPTPPWIEDSVIRRDLAASHRYLAYLLPLFLERCEHLETLVAITNDDESLEDIDEAFEAYERFNQLSRMSQPVTYIEAGSFRLRAGQEKGTEAKRDPRLVVIPDFHHPKNCLQYWSDICWRGEDFWDITEGLARAQR
ncbi:hypothetical protein D9758_016262 [Tetrapyrgos nigripes]|uniref:Uncharacterized protein n=1 Tax=Tetrapyrgos nigripes TaxID=182062 RepID=A0A8H5BYW0_9AGAR|nr:hypothetical protein D9758_016262 [Tetrapyrgos nigripes]